MATSKPRQKKRAKKAVPPKRRPPSALAELRAQAERLLQSERALQESEARFRDFAQASGDWFWETDADNRYAWFSGNLEQLVGRPPDFYLGRDRFEVATASGADLQAEPWKSHIAAIRRREPFRDFVHRRALASGDIWLSLSGVPRFDAGGAFLGYRAAVTNITSRVRAEQTLAEREARFRDLAEAAGDWFWEADIDDRFTWVSESIERFTGRPVSHFIGKTRTEAALAAGVDIDAESWRANLAAVARRVPFRNMRTRRVSPNGEEIWTDASAVPRFDAAGRFLGYRGAVSNITAVVALEARAREADARLHAAIESLGESVSVTDSEDRIVVANRAFLELNQIEDASFLDARPTYEEHVRRLVAKGMIPKAEGREEAWIAQRMEQRRRGGVTEVARSGDRWVRITEQPLPGGGAITFALDITARKRAEQELAQSEARFRDIATASGEWFWETDAAFRYTWISDSIADLGGETASSLLGKSRMELAAKRGVDLAAEPWRSHIETLGRHEPFRGFRYIREVDGKPRWISSSGLPVFDPDGAFRGYRGVGIDITREVELERQANEADQRLRAAIEGLGESISLTDAEDRIVLTNRAFRELNQYTDFLERKPRYEEHLRAALSKGRVPEAAGREEAWLRERMAKRRAGGSTEVRRRNDRWMLVTEQRLPDGGTLTFSMDISAQKQVELALRDLNASLEQRVAERTAELKTAYQELESFSYSVSHDLRAPLRAISGFAGILREEESSRLSESGLRHLGTIDASAQQMGKLVDALLELVRMSRHAISGARLDMAQIARDVAQQLLAEHPRARVEVGEMPPATGDATLVRQVYANLVGNALKYASRQDAPRVDIGAERGPAGTVYFVRDNGVGFDMRYSGKLFKPFERLHTDPGFKGTGIGLALASLIVHRHGGRIEADSAPGEGATFRFTLGGS